MANVDRGSAFAAVDVLIAPIEATTPSVVCGQELRAILLDIATDAGDSTADDTARTTNGDGTSQGEAFETIKVGPGDAWFERLHIFPGSLIDFGNVITQAEDTFEIYNAFRETQVAIASTTDDVTPGVELPDITTPVVIEAQTSLFRDTTTSNRTATPGLGTIVLTRVIVLTEGLASFDGSIIFQALPPAGDVALRLAGTRVVLLPFEYEQGLRETIEHFVTVTEARSGKERRASLRSKARQGFVLPYKLDGVERQQMQAQLFDRHASILGLPLWHERVQLTAAITAGATSLPVTGADDVDFRVGGLVAIITDSRTYEVIEIASVTDTAIGLTDPITGTYPVRTPVMPTRLARLSSKVELTKSLVELEQFTLVFDVDDNDTGASAGSLTPGFWSTFNGRVLLNEGNVVNGNTTRQTLERKLFIIDNQIGKRAVSTYWTQDRRLGEKGFVARSRTEVKQLRQLLLGLRGRQIAFYLPSEFGELTPVDDLTSGATVLDIENIGYTRFVQTRTPFTEIAVVLTDGSVVTRTVASSSELSDTVERLVVSVAWSSTIALEDIERIELYELVRSGTDRFDILHERIGKASCFIPIVGVFDDA